MYFMLDENVPVSVQRTIVRLGHSATFIRDYVPPGSPDQLVATVSEEMNAILLSFDGDFQKIAPQIPEGYRRRFKDLSRIWMRCEEPQAANRFEAAADLIDYEYAKVDSGELPRIQMQIGKSYLRTNR